MPERGAVLSIRGLHVYYGRSHALQGVELEVASEAVAVVGRNGMGKTTLCNAVTGLVPVAAGSIRFAGRELAGRRPAEIARLGVGYVPQGRRLWRSLTVEEHLRLVGRDRGGEWTVDRVYATFPRLAERRRNLGSELSGGEQQMLAIARALLCNPRLLVLDEPTEGLAPVIVRQVEEILLGLVEEAVDILLIEQNIGVATAVAAHVAIMVNGRIERVVDARELAEDRELQQRLLGVRRLAGEEAEPAAPEPPAAAPAARRGPVKIWSANPVPPTRWSPPLPLARIEATARVVTTGEAPAAGRVVSHPLRRAPAAGRNIVLVCGTLDTKGVELRHLRDLLRRRGIAAQLVDLSTSGSHAGAEVPARQIAVFHPQGPSAVFTGDRGRSVAAMALAFERWIRGRGDIAGILGIGGSGGTAMIAPAMRALPFGVPKILVSTVASGDVRRYVGASDIVMMHSVADLQGLNAITGRVLENAAHAMAGMVEGRRAAAAEEGPARDRTSVGLTMFGVTTPCVRRITEALGPDCDCLVFHATGIGGQCMESLVDSGMIEAVVDVTTTEVCDLLCGGVFPAGEDRFGAVIRRRVPYVGSCGALDMVNFGPPDSIPERYRGRRFYEHNPQVTLMRTTAEECRRIGTWIGERLNRMEGPTLFFVPEGGVSALDAPGQPFFDPEADAALFAALEGTVRRTSSRRLIRLPHHVNDPAFAEAVVDGFRTITGLRPRRRQLGR